MNPNGWYKFYKLAFRNKLDLFSKKLAKNVFNNLIKNDKITGKFQYVINSSQEKELEDYGVKEIVFVIDLYAIAFKVDGHYLPDQNNIVIGIEINPKMLSKDAIKSENYENVIQEVKYTVRHELEHAYYNKLYNYSEPSYKIPNSFNNYRQYVLSAERYLLDPSEIDSYIRELMLKAKNKRVLMDNLLVEMVNHKITEIAPDTMTKEMGNNTEEGKFYKSIIDKILNIYRNRIGSIYNKGK